MRLTPITDHAYQLTRQGWMNCYLVREPDGFTLIDSTLPGWGKEIISTAERLGAPIRRILLTHAHGDHVGSVDELIALLPGVALAASERSVPLLSKPPSKATMPGEPHGKIRGSLPGIAAQLTQVVEDGGSYGSLRCIATPGHIPGHFAFLDERDGTLYAGDELCTIGRLAVWGWSPWYFPVPRLVYWSRPLIVESARRLLGYPLQRFAAGHGALRGGGVQALEWALRETTR